MSSMSSCHQLRWAAIYFKSSRRIDIASALPVSPEIEAKTIEWSFLGKIPLVAIVFMSSMVNSIDGDDTHAHGE